MQKKTVSRIAEELSGAGEAEEETQKEVQGEVLLTPIQREFFSKRPAGTLAFQSVIPVGDRGGDRW